MDGMYSTSSVDRFTQSESERVMRYALALFTCLQKPLICETSMSLFVSETSAHNEFYTHTLAILQARARVLAHRTHVEYTVRVLAHALAILRACTMRASGNERVRASTSELLRNARARTFKTYYKCMAKLRYIAILASLFTYQTFINCQLW